MFIFYIFTFIVYIKHHEKLKSDTPVPQINAKTKGVRSSIQTITIGTIGNTQQIVSIKIRLENIEIECCENSLFCVLAMILYAP